MDRTLLRDFLIISGVLFLAYGSALGGVFGGDDLILIENVRDTTWSFTDLSRAFEWDEHDITDGWLPPTFQSFRLQYFRPAIVASIKLDRALWGGWAPGYFLTNIILYGAIAFLVYFWGADFGLDRRQRLLLAVLFVSYSVNSVAVNRINGRTELVAALFLLSSVVALGRFHTNRRPLFLAAAVIAAVLALGSKENSVMLPFFHIAAAFFLYPPDREKRWREIFRRAWAIAPFFVLIPIYLIVRTAVLDGFPIPPRGFYFHPPSDPGFGLFVFAKLVHAPLALLFQLPAQLFPVFLERSIPLLIIALMLAVPATVVVLRDSRPPFRTLFIAWIVIALAPTLPMGYNALYFFLCSPLVAVLYVKSYRAGIASGRPWHRRAARVLLPMAIVLGILVCNGSTLAVRNEGLPARDAAARIAPLLDRSPAAKHVNLVDVPPACIYTLKPAIAFYLPRHAGRTFSILSVTADLAGAVPSIITQQDAFSFDLQPERGAYLRTGLEEILLQQSLPTFAPGMVARHGTYRIEVMEVEERYIRDEGELVVELRDHFDAPPEHQRGILRLRFQFEAPLSSDELVFIQLGDDTGRAVEFE